MKSYFKILALVLIVASFYLAIASRENGDSKRLDTIPVSSAVLNTTSILSTHSRLPREEEVVVLPSWRKLSESSAVERYEPLLDPKEVGDNTDSLVATASRGNSSAAIALYSYCVALLYPPTYSGDIRVLTEFERLNLCGDSNLRWLVEAAKAGDMRALVILLGILRDRPYSSADTGLRSLVLTNLESAAEQGDLVAMRLLSTSYYDEILVSRDAVKAFTYMDIYASATGDSAAHMRAREVEKLLRSADREAAHLLKTRITFKLRKAGKI